ncbi:TerB N-terminal domain-containing protein [Actinomadura sp. DC4]|uniref:tellurite resistance TerB family protein n=1 Tax=Actinomadura sp. DC4 TaxID=3055069 RepID=UPI0025B27894|nr:TerB N-terminal domain-containing protein [Actinomadura sp. DC4]MDN3351455.1 TerB N-terminal domain-containing protein [Actinomadura sp. DC4]
MGGPGWTLARHPVTVAGLRFPGDMLYVGRGLAAASGTTPEPALIDPWLPVDWRAPDWHGEATGYWPSYATMSPAGRAAYLYWLSTGRRHPDVHIGYVFLFFYGLERRVLLELPHHPAAQRIELPAIRAEVDELLRIHGDTGSFGGYARRFRDALDLIGLLESDVCAATPPPADRRTPPARLRLGLSGFAASRRPLPADWAYSWLMSCAGFPPRTATGRCAQEFGRLFHARYAARYGPGLVIGPEGPDIGLGYRPASAGFRGWDDLVVHGRPEVFGLAPAERELIGLGVECAQALDAYSRFLGREPGGRGSIAAAGLLPAELLAAGPGEAGALTRLARERLGGASAVTVPAGDLFDAAPSARPAGKKGVVAVAQVLAAAGIGIEPDPRLGGPAAADGPVVLFAEAEPCAAPTAAYRTAALLLHLGVAVGAADGSVSAPEKAALTRHLERALDLSPAERNRLEAHLRWLLAREPELTRLTHRVAGLERSRREDIAAFLTTVAEADGVVDPDEVRVLRRIRTLLGLDPGAVPDEPVTVRPADPSQGHAIPAPVSVRLDESALAAKMAEAAEVAALLDSVFAEDEPPAPSPPEVVTPVAGLDAAHSALLRALAGRDTISRGEWERLAGGVRLMPDGALDRINESAYEIAGEPVAEGDDPIEVNRYAMGELL